jgi:hypothetical protein
MIQFDWSEKIQNWVFKTWLENKGADVKIAVLDTGVDLAHPSLSSLNQKDHKINTAVPGFDPGRLKDFCNEDVTDRHQQRGHGTQCVSVLSAVEEGGNILRGFVPRSEIFIIKVNTVDHKTFLVKNFLKGLEAAAILKVDIVISSISFPKEDVALENIPPAEIERVFTLLRNSGAVLFAALPNTTILTPWAGLAAENFPNHRPEAINTGVISEKIYNKRKAEISMQPDIHFVVSDAAGAFCKINNEYATEPVTSSYAVYLIGGVAALYISSIKKREKEAYKPRERTEFLKGLSQQFNKLSTANNWDATQSVLFKTNVVDLPV